MLKYVLRCACVIASFSQIFSAAAASGSTGWPDPKDGETCYARLAVKIEFPKERIEAWDKYIHPLIETPFIKADKEYSKDLRNLCNVAFYFIEQGMGKVFEDGLLGNQDRVQKMLAPELLEVETKISKDLRLKAQAGILMWVITAHPMQKK